MSYTTEAILRDTNNDPIPQIWDDVAEEFKPYQLRDLRGLLANRPAADTVDAGTTWWATDRLGETDEVTVSDGTNWLEV